MKNESNINVIDQDLSHLCDVVHVKMGQQKVLICKKHHSLNDICIGLNANLQIRKKNNGNLFTPGIFNPIDVLTHRKYKEHEFCGIIGYDSHMQELFKAIKDITKFNLPVLIQGENGTGKELVTKTIHHLSSMKSGPFVMVNCGELANELLERELFGYVKGAFDGAVCDQKGKIEFASGGTLFLKEIENIPINIQKKLLKVLQECKTKRIGSYNETPVNIRIISSSNGELKKEVKHGNFISDLYDRINIVPFEVPPLRKRKADIPLLIDFFLENAFYNGRLTLGLAKDTLQVMLDYPWPDNVLELKSVIHYAVINSKGKVIQPNHLPSEFDRYRKKYEVQDKIISSPSVGRPLKLDLQKVEDALSRSGGNKARAARLLLVGRATLYKFLNNHPKLYNNFVKQSKMA